MTTTLLTTINRGRTLRARWQRSPTGALMCTWVTETSAPAVRLERRTPIRLTGGRRLPSSTAALRALTAALDHPGTAA